MEKTLTISIAAYNVEDYIEDTLNSLIVPEILDDLEVFIIDDGGCDKTLSIAEKYEKEYPNTFHAIHKENGGYGTTVNWSVKNATGKYIKLLDGDDWFDTNGLKQLIKCLKKTDVDVIISNSAFVKEGRKKEMYPHCKKLSNRTMTLDEASNLPVVAMWGYCFKLDMLRKNYSNLPEKTLYTDQIFVMRALSKAKTVQFIGEIVYYWRLGRDEQSNNINSIRKNYKDIIKVADIISKEYQNMIKNENEELYQFQLKRAAAYYSVSIVMLCRLEHNKKNLKLIKEWEKKTKLNAPHIYRAAKQSKKVALLRGTKYLAYWFIKF